MYFFYYFPVGLDIETRRTPAITLFLAAVSVTTFLLYRYLPYEYGWRLARMIFYPSDPSVRTSFTYVFLHAGYLHLIGNIVYLLLFGRVIEDRFGPGRFFLIFVFSAMAGVWSHLVLTSIFSPQYLGYGILGASGATSGLLGAFMARFYFSRIRVAYWVFMPLQGVNRAGRKYLPGFLAVALWMVFQGVFAVVQFGIEGVQVAYSVHIGGFACGFLLASAFGAKAGARAERRLVKARRYFRESNWFAAQGEYINYLELSHEDAGVHAEAARAFLCSGEKGRATYHFTEAITGFMKILERGEAETVFAEAMRSVSGFSLQEKAQLDLAFGAERSLKYNCALSAYRNFIEGYPASNEVPFVLLRMAGIHEKRFNRPADAILCYKKLIEEYPEDSWADFARSEMDRLKDRVVTLEALCNNN